MIFDSRYKNYRYNWRIQVEQEELCKVFILLKEKGYSLKKVNEIIDYNFKNALYNGYSIKAVSFKKQQKLVGYPIPHSIKEPIINPFTLL